MADDSIINYSDLIGKDATFDDLSNEIDNLKAELLDLAKVYQKALSGLKPSDTNGIEDMDNKIKELIVTQKNLLKVEKMGRDAKKKNIELTQEQLIQAQSEKMAQRERVKEAKQLAILRKSEEGSIESLRARLALVTVEWKKLTAEERKNGKTVKINGKDVKNLVKEKKKLTDELKRLEKQTGDTRRNVGNYSDSLSKLGKVTARVFLGRTAIDGLRRIGTAFSDIIEKNKDTDASIGRLSNALGQFGKSAGGLGLTILKLVSGPLTSLLNGVKSVLDFLSGASNEIDKFSATSDELAGVTDKLSQEFTKEAAAADQVFTALENANEGSQERKDLIDQVNKQYGKYLPNLLDEKSTLEDIASAQRLVNQALTQGFLIRIQQATQTDIFTNKVKAQRAAFENLRDVAERTGKTIDAGLLASFSDLVENLGSSSKEFEAVRDIIEGNSNSFSKFNQELFKTNPSLLELARQLKVAGNSDTILALLDSAAAETNNYNEAIGDTQASLKGLQDSLPIYTREVDDNTDSVKENTDATKKNADARLAAIEKLRDALEDAETDNIEEQTRRALELERLRFEREQELRNENFDKLKIQFKDNEKELREIEDLNQKLSEEQLTSHEKKKAEIRLKGSDEIKDITTIGLQDANAEEQKLLDEKVEAVEDSNKKISKSNEELFKSINQAAQKVSAIVSDLFKKQVDQASANVEEQTKNLERAEERAQQGLESNIAFERKELAARQSERLQREKEAANAAKLTTLFNLVSAYAQGGDENALFRGLADFALLEAFGAGIQGFFDGTENVERDLGGASKFFQGQRDAYLGVTNSGKLLRFDGKERIFNPAQNALLGGMSNEEAVNNALVGSWVSDNFQASSIMGNSIFGTQKANFETAMKPQKQQQDSRLIQEVRALRQAVSSKPSSDVDMVKVYKNITDLVKREVKSAMTRTSKKRLS